MGGISRRTFLQGAAAASGGVVVGGGLQTLFANAASAHGVAPIFELGEVADLRDAAVVRDPDQFDPLRWAASDVHWQFNHLSNGRQSCAGRRLALFLAKAVVSELFAVARLDVRRPRLPVGGRMPETFNWFRFDAAATPA